VFIFDADPDPDPTPYFNLGPDQAFHFDADPDPPFYADNNHWTILGPSVNLHGGPPWLLRIRIQLFTLMRIRLLNLKATF
jgi:hypothetical protein